jgi:hypothetical protein
MSARLAIVSAWKGPGLGKSAARAQVLEGDLPPHVRHDMARDLEADALHPTRLNRLPSRLTDPRPSGCLPLPQLPSLTPTLHTFAYCHVDL